MSKPNVKARRKRLLVLADFLEDTVLPMLDGAKFDMGQWGRANRQVPDDLAATSECGFAGCALGWGYYCRPLRRAGIRSVIVNEFGALRIRWNRNYVPLAAEFFGLTEDEFDQGFMPDSYGLKAPTGRSGIRRVISRLRQIATAEVSE